MGAYGAVRPGKRTRRCMLPGKRTSQLVRMKGRPTNMPIRVKKNGEAKAQWAPGLELDRPTIAGAAIIRSLAHLFDLHRSPDLPPVGLSGLAGLGHHRPLVFMLTANEGPRSCR
jgi:hypothetical protein